MKKRTIKKRFMGLDKLAMPAKETVLPKEALAKPTAPAGTEKRRSLLRPLTVSLSVVALIVATALAIIAVTSHTPKNTNQGTTLDNSIVAGTEGSDESQSEVSADKDAEQMPILFYGSYDPKTDGVITKNDELAQEEDDWYLKPGEVGISTMKAPLLSGMDDINDLQEGVLYPVSFSADFYGSDEYQEGCLKLTEEKLAKKAERQQTLIAFIEKYAADRTHFFFKYYEGFDYHTVCELIYKQNHPEHWPGQDAPEFDDMVALYKTTYFEEYQAKHYQLWSQIKKAATEKMYKYLEGEGIRFYDKTVYYYDGTQDNIHHESLCRTAFLTKSEIAALRGGEDYGLRVIIVFEELAGMDNEPVYLDVSTLIVDANA